MELARSVSLDGAVVGNQVRFIVQLDFMGNTVKAEAKGKIVGDTLELTPAMPGPPPQGGDAAQGGPPQGGQGGPGGPMKPLVFHRKA